MVTTGIEIKDIRINGRLFEETKEAFEYWADKQEREVELDYVTWAKRIYAKCIHDVLSIKRADE